VRLNLTGSLPVGLYAVTHGAPARGSLVLVCLPRAVAEFARDRGYVPRGGSCPGGVMPVGKPVFAIPGDTVTVTRGGLLLGGRPAPNSRPLPADRQGRPLAGLPAGRYIVGPGELWVVSGYSGYSFDSRYFGPVPSAGVLARLAPVSTSAATPHL
jgi:conjugative transfer signal peptidase TraF